MENVHFVNLIGIKTVFPRVPFYSFSPQLIDIELNLPDSKAWIGMEK
jgi:hypothetical protein